MPSPRKFRTEDPTPTPDFLDIAQKFQSTFGRFSLDLGGLLLLVFSLLTFLALFEWSQGTLLTPWAFTLRRWLGWGSYLLAFSMLVASGFLFYRRNVTINQWPWGRLIALELAYVFFIVTLSILGGSSIERSEAGLDGGYIGWSLSYLLSLLMGDIGRNLIVGFGLFFSIFFAFGLAIVVENALWRFSGEAVDSLEPFPTVSGTKEQAQPEVQKQPEKRSASRKPGLQIPEQFRKNFKVPETQDEVSITPLVRGEQLPPLTLLFSDQASRPDERQINLTAGLLEKTLSEFGIPAQVVGFRIGPTVTQFAVQPGFIKKPGTNEDDMQQMKVRVAQIASLQKDLALALSAERLRIEAPVPGKSYVGIEVPNAHTSTVRLKALLESEQFNKLGAPLATALGRDVSGQPLVADLARMPHLLVAGSTGSGKSVCITAIAACLAMNNSPDELRLVMIDSKMVELIRFNGLPHLYGKVETNAERIMGVLRWLVVEMEHRYRLLEGAKARDLEAYNRKIRSRKDAAVAPLPRIVVIIDELADLMMSAPDQTEHNLVRLAQMARATGIHLIVATQRPSTDVVTGLIKANFPARLAFSVTSGIDSRVILDVPGAENLLGRGDMLFLNPEIGNPLRAQGVLITDQEIERIIAFWQKLVPASSKAPPWESILSEPEENGDDNLIEQAIAVVQQSQRASASLLQRRLRIGYPRAARLLDQLEEMGIVGPSQGGGRERDVFVDSEDDSEFDTDSDSNFQ